MLTGWRSGGRAARLFLAGSAVSFVGDGIRYAALPLVAVENGTGPAGLGVLLAAATVPFLLVGLVGGVVVDRMSRRRVLLTCDAARFVVMGAFAGIAAQWSPPFALLCVVAFVMGALESVATSATFAFVPNITDGEALGPVNADLSAALTIGRSLAGPLIGAALVGLSRGLPFGLDAASFAASYLCIVAIRVTEPARPAVTRDIVAELRESARWLRATPYMLTLAMTAAAMNLVNMGVLATQPDFVTRGLGAPASAYGVLLASSAVGGVLGTRIAERVDRRLRLLGTVAVALTLYGGGYVFAASAWNVWPAYAGVAVTGAGAGLWAVTTVTWRQRMTPDHLRGRADALIRFVAWGVLPVGSLLGGLTSSMLGPRAPFALAGAVPLLMVPAYVHMARSERAATVDVPVAGAAVTP